jgi:hypothetical protein
MNHRIDDVDCDARRMFIPYKAPSELSHYRIKAHIFVYLFTLEVGNGLMVRDLKKCEGRAQLKVDFRIY